MEEGMASGKWQEHREDVYKKVFVGTQNGGLWGLRTDVPNP